MMPILRALRSRNYALFFTGQSISLIGTWMQQTAVAWLVYRLTGSALILGFVGFSSQIPAFFLTPFAGVIADRSNRHVILITTQALAMAQALVLAGFVMTGVIRIWEVIALSALLGVINAVDIPVRHSFVIDMVDRRDDLGNAIALNSMIFNGARFIGPSLAGLIIGRLNEGACFLINGLSYIAVIVGLLAMRLNKNRIVIHHKTVLEGLRDGFTHAFTFAPIRRILALLSITSLFGGSYLILMPIFAKEVLKGDAMTLGLLIGVSGIGALLGAIYLASRKKTEGLLKVIILSTAVLGLSLIAFSASRTLSFSLFFMVFVGFGVIVQAVGSNTLLQFIVDDDKRGRIMSLFAMSFMGMMPIGSLLSGFLAAKIGAPFSLAISGSLCFISALIFGRRMR